VASVVDIDDSYEKEAAALRVFTPPSNATEIIDVHELRPRSMVKEITKLALPALGGSLMDPVMSLVDTACVGQVSSLQLASLAPCTSVCQFLFFAFFFLSTGTTTFVAANPPDATGLQPEEVERRLRFNEQILSSTSLLAVVLGVVSAAVLLMFPDTLLSLAGCAPGEMMKHGRTYLRIRALGLPPVFLAMVMQGASLGRQDAWTPLKIFAAAGVANLVGDVVLTLRMGYGVTGAAVATVASQAVAAAYFLYRSIRLRRSSSSAMTSGGSDGTAAVPTAAAEEEEETAAEEKSNKSNNKLGVALAWRGLPDKETKKSFSTVALTLMMRSMVNMASYSMMTRAAGGMGTSSLAAHLVTLQIFWMLSFVPDCVGTACQSLISRDLKDRPWRVPAFTRVAYGMSALSGGLMAALTGGVLTSPSISKAIVADPVVRALLVTICPFAMLAQAACSVSCLSDSICLGLQEIKHLPYVTAAATAALGGGLWSLLRYGTMGVEGIWLCANLFFGVRFAGQILFSHKLKNILLRRGRAPDAEYRQLVIQAQ